jgi:hypothetical protein
VLPTVNVMCDVMGGCQRCRDSNQGTERLLCMCNGSARRVFVLVLLSTACALSRQHHQ